MNSDLLEEVNRRLGVIIALLGQQVPNDKNKKSLREQIKALDAYGLRPTEIAAVLNKKSNYINKELTMLRKGK